MTKVTEAVKATLVGTEEELGLSHQIKANFIQYAQKDETTGELYMTEDNFVNAIAPNNQDYVSATVQRPDRNLLPADPVIVAPI
jgi:solute carrier family 25 aspartate/glutamate transporter 12/13